jgi:Outer membrane protein beta-barrel domain
MLRLSTVLLALLLLTASASSLFAQDKLVVFGGYSYLRPPITADETNCPTPEVCPVIPVFLLPVTSRQNLNGWEFTGTYRFLPFLGLAADFSGHYGPTVGNSNGTSRTHQYTYLFGPEVSLPSRVSPFAHVLFGGTHQSISASSFAGSNIVNSVLATTDSGFATAIGAGIDLKLIPHVWIRPIQIDYLVTRLHSNTQNQARVSAGVVFHF